MANLLNEHKLGDQTIKLVKEAQKEIFHVQAKAKVKTAALITLPATTPSTPLHGPPLNIYSPISEGHPEA